MKRTLLTALLVLLWTTPWARASEVPAESIVWWSFDPTRFERAEREPTPEAFLPLLRAGVGSGLFGSGTEASILEGMLAASEVGRAPHTFAVIEFSAERDENNEGMVVRELSVVLELRTSEGHDRFLRTLRRIAFDAPRAKEGAEGFEAVQSRVELPGGRTGVVLRDNRDADWESLAWCSEEGVFTIGYGNGALERWFAEDRRSDDPVWAHHRASVEDARAAGDVVLEAFVDIRALRQRFPSAFAHGRTPRMLEALGLQRAWTAMLHARFVDDPEGPFPLLVMDHTAARDDAVERIPWSLDAWPADLPRVPRDAQATYALVASPRWRAFVDWAIDVHNATVNTTSLPAHLASVERWRARHGRDLDQLLTGLGPYLVMTDAPQPPAPVPGLATVWVPLDGEPMRTAHAMRRALASFGERVRTDRREKRISWSYAIDSAGIVRLPVWSMMGDVHSPALVGGWGHPCLREAERWIASEGDDQ